MANVVRSKGSSTTPQILKCGRWILLAICLFVSACASGNDVGTEVTRPTESAETSQALSTVAPTSAEVDPTPTGAITDSDIEQEAVTAEPYPTPPTPSALTEESETAEQETPEGYVFEEDNTASVQVAVTIDPDLQDVAVNENFYISYSNASPVENEDAQVRSVALTVSLGSQSELSADVTEESLVFIDSEGALHVPAPAPEIGYQPYLVGSAVEAQDGVIGFVIFDLPPEIGEGLLVWCPEEPYPCSAPAEVTIDELIPES